MLFLVIGTDKCRVLTFLQISGTFSFAGWIASRRWNFKLDSLDVASFKFNFHREEADNHHTAGHREWNNILDGLYEEGRG
jgi:hypothetical protein